MAELQNTRKLYIDNIRWGIIILVVIFHVVDIFNSTGAILHFNYPGIAAFDSFAYFVYPWFMGCLFVVAGISARYSLNKRNVKEFAKGRVLKLLIPFLAGMLLLAPLTSALSFTITNSWNQFSAIPSVVLYFVMVAIGMGQLWFILELFVVSMIFLLIKHFDKKDKIWILGGKTSIWILLLMYIPLLGTAQILNFLAVFRNVLFLSLFLLGYFVFSHDKIQEMLKKYRIPLLTTALILFVIQIFMYWGQNFTSIVNKPIVMLYTWFMILAVIGNAQVYFNFSNHFTEYMNKKSFLIYIFHYLPMIAIAYLITKNWHLPIILNYLFVLVFSTIATFIICEFIPKIPGVRFLFGVNGKQS